MEYKYRFSIFTATFNRGDLLKRVYSCLLRQTFKDFEWIIINDGSTDDTDCICKGFIKDNKIPIKYLKKQNGGKHTAWRAAQKLFEGRYEVGADDDDTFPNNMLEIFDRYWSQLEKEKNYDDFWEIRGRCADENGNLIGGVITKESYIDSDYNEVFYKYKIKEEMQGCRKTTVLANEAAVPEHFIFDNKVSNFPEGIRWSRAARKYKTRFISDIVRFYYKTNESLTSSNSGSRRSLKKTYNSLCGNIYVLNERRDLMLKYDKKQLIRTYMNLAYQSICVKENIIKLINCKIDKLMTILLYFPMIIIYIFRK